jgi:hypothetical protein
MPIIAFTFLILLGTSINDYNAGGTKTLEQAKNNIVEIVKTPKPADFSKLNK